MNEYEQNRLGILNSDQYYTSVRLLIYLVEGCLCMVTSCLVGTLA